MTRFARLVAAVILGLLMIISPADAETYPSRPIHIIVPSGPGGSLDIIGRVLGQKLSESLKQPVIIDNRPGASGGIGAAQAARSASDGYTLLIGSVGVFAMNVVTYHKLPYHGLTDFAPISLIGDTEYLLAVHPSVPASTLQEFIALAKARPGEITYASFGLGGVSHMFAEAFSLQAGVKMLHVPYKSAPDAMNGLVGGQVMALFDAMPVLLPQVRDNRLRVLANGGEKRSPVAPEIPTFAEGGLPGFTSTGWFALVAPKNTQQDVIALLHAEIVKALAAPDVRARFESIGLRVIGSTPEELAAQIRRDIEKYGEVARAANIQIE
jgi:tripartite-type tricarboxylate transporter receptor subunit TctC